MIFKIRILQSNIRIIKLKYKNIFVYINILSTNKNLSGYITGFYYYDILKINSFEFNEIRNHHLLRRYVLTII